MLNGLRYICRTYSKPPRALKTLRRDKSNSVACLPPEPQSPMYTVSLVSTSEKNCLIILTSIVLGDYRVPPPSIYHHHQGTGQGDQEEQRKDRWERGQIRKYDSSRIISMVKYKYAN